MAIIASLTSSVATSFLRVWYPAKAPITAPGPPSNAPRRPDGNAVEKRQKPQKAPEMIRAIKGRGAMRLGVFGSKSATYSPTASRVKITSAIFDPINATGVPENITGFRYAAQDNAAGAVKVRSPATK